MINQALIHHLVAEQDLVRPILFKPGQFRIIQKLDLGQPLTLNEQRYVRGQLGKKLRVLEGLLTTKPPAQELAILLNFSGPYYITGLEALKHNGYGWFYEPKIIEVINTKIEGKMACSGKTIKFIRVRSLSKGETVLDPENGLRYASNDQVFKDLPFTRNEYAKTLWLQMHQRYGKVFSTLEIKIPEEELDLSGYGM